MIIWHCYWFIWEEIKSKDANQILCGDDFFGKFCSLTHFHYLLHFVFFLFLFLAIISLSHLIHLSLVFLFLCNIFNCLITQPALHFWDFWEAWGVGELWSLVSVYMIEKWLEVLLLQYMHKKFLGTLQGEGQNFWWKVPLSWLIFT